MLLCVTHLSLLGLDSARRCVLSTDLSTTISTICCASRSLTTGISSKSANLDHRASRSTAILLQVHYYYCSKQRRLDCTCHTVYVTHVVIILPVSAAAVLGNYQLYHTNRRFKSSSLLSFISNLCRAHSFFVSLHSLLAVCRMLQWYG